MVYKDNINKKYLCSFIGALTEYYEKIRGFEIRSQLKNMFHNKTDVFFELKNEWFYHDMVYEHQVLKKDITDKIKQNQIDTEKYNSILSDSIFSLCPEGTGPNTLRLWESMSIGVIPVLFESDWVRPHEKDLDWLSFSVTIPKKDIDKTYNILQSFSKNEIENMKINCINAYNYIRTKTCF